jgi:hypothetical protein
MLGLAGSGPGVLSGEEEGRRRITLWTGLVRVIVLSDGDDMGKGWLRDFGVVDILGSTPVTRRLLLAQ